VTVVRSQESVLDRWRDARDELRGLGAEAGEIASGMGRVARGDARLAVAEVRDGIRATTRTAIVAGVALVLAVVTVGWLPLPILLGLGEAMPLWAASLVTVGITAVLALALGLFAWHRFRRTSLIPREALKRAKEDKEWLKQQLFEGGN
jgi:uncharacterized membrane protein YqjE